MDVARFGRAIRALRRRRRWRQIDLARAAGVSATRVGRVERGEARRMPVDVLDRVAQAAGASLELVLRWKGEGLDRLLDEQHARLAELVVLRLRALGWDVAVEVSFARAGERGSIDVLAFHPVRRALAMIEVKSVTPDMQAMLGGIGRKGRLAPAIARERGWHATNVARILVLADLRTNRRRLGEHDASVRSMLPAGTRAVVRWLRDPTPPAASGVWFVSDPRTAHAEVPGRERVTVNRAHADIGTSVVRAGSARDDALPPRR